MRGFLNTRGMETGVDTLATPEALVGWLRENGLVDRKTPLKASVAEVTRVQRFRETLHALARRNNGELCACDADVLDVASVRSRFAISFDPLTGSASLRPAATGIDGALGRILATVHVAMADRSWSRLKACAEPTCAWAFYDHSKNGCSRWCSAETCGNRSKVKRYRERQAEQKNA